MSAVRADSVGRARRYLGNYVAVDEAIISPATCRDKPSSESVWLLSGANASQEYQYWRYDNGVTSPTHFSGVINSYDPLLRAGFARVGFFVATFGSYYSEHWSLNFFNVASYTL